MAWLSAEVVEYACGIAPQLMGEFVENVSSGIDTYSLRQPLGVRRHAGNTKQPCQDSVQMLAHLPA